MASRLLNVFDNIERGRQYCVTKAREHGHMINDDANFYVIGDCIADNLIPAPEIHEDWVRDPHLLDPHDIVNMAGEIEYDGDTYYPGLIFTYTKDCDSIYISSRHFNINSFTKNATTGVTNRIYIKMSDGTEYNYSQITTSSTAQQHVFAEGTENKFMIVYVPQYFIPSFQTSTHYELCITSWNIMYGNTGALNKNPITQILFNNVYYGNVILSDCDTLISLEDTEGCRGWMGGGSGQHYFRNCYRLIYVKLYGLTSLQSGGSTTTSYFSNNTSLEYLEFPNLNTFNITSSGASFGYSTNILKLDMFNNLTSLTVDGNFLSGGSSPDYLDWSNIDFTCNRNGTHLQTTRYLKCKSFESNGSNSFPSLLKLEVSDASNYNTLTVDAMQSFVPQTNSTLVSINSKVLKLLDLTKVSLIPTSGYVYLGNCPRCSVVVWPATIPTDFRLQGFRSLTRDNLLDLFDKLPNGGGSITLTESVYEKLHIDDIAIAISKGWEVINNG